MISTPSTKSAMTVAKADASFGVIRIPRPVRSSTLVNDDERRFGAGQTLRMTWGQNLCKVLTP